MQPDAFIVPDDPSKLRELVDVLMSELKSSHIKITDLEQRLAGMNRHRFGTRSENADQLNLTLENAEIAATWQRPMAPKMSEQTDIVDDDAPRKPKRKPLPDHLERNETVLTPSSDSCGSCGGAMRQIGEDATEELEYVPGRFIVNWTCHVFVPLQVLV